MNILNFLKSLFYKNKNIEKEEVQMLLTVDQLYTINNNLSSF